MATSTASPAPHTRTGMFYGAGAYAIWGCLPLLLALMKSVPPLQMVAHRVIWSCVFLAAFVTLTGRWRMVVELLARPRTVAALCCAAALLSTNWLLLIYAIQQGHLLSASIAFFITPLMSIGLGVFVLKERLNGTQTVAVVLAMLGVLALAATGGAALWLPFSIAGSIALYGLVRKLTPTDALSGVMVETAMLAPLSLLFLSWCAMRNTLSFGDSAAVKYYLAISGASTAIPLLMFAAATKRLRLSMLGFLQYILPSLQFLEAVLLFGETLTAGHLITFGCIWAALIVYAADSIRTARAEALMTPE